MTDARMINTRELPTVLKGATKVFMMHMNYKSRAREHGDFPAFPVFYLKPPSTLSPSGADILSPAGAKGLVAEAEIALVIGKEARGLSEAEAWSYVGWVAPANDVTVLDFMYSEYPSLVRAKGWDSFTPIGALVDARRVDPGDLTLRLILNGEVRQNIHSSDLIFKFARLVAELSQEMTLSPGDVILTGTPAGAPRIQDGDEVTVELVGLSSVTSRVREAAAGAASLVPKPMLTPKMRAHVMGVVAQRAFDLDPELRARLARADSKALVDALQRAGHAAELIGAATARGRRFLGHAVTVTQVAPRGRAGSAELDAVAARCLQPLRALGADEVAIFDGAPTAELLTDLASAWTRKRPAGLVAASGGPATAGEVTVVTLQTTPSTRTIPVAADQPITLAGITVLPGDLIIADESGVAVIPPGSVEPLKALAVASGKPA